MVHCYNVGYYVKEKISLRDYDLGRVSHLVEY